jgi:hypothetical protein
MIKPQESKRNEESMTTLKIPQIKLFIEQYRISWEENTEL